MKKKHYLWTALFTVLIVTSVGIFSSCQKMETTESEKIGMFTRIDVKDIPENVTPVYCESQEQADYLIKSMLEKRVPTDTKTKIHLGEIPIIQFPIIKTKAEDYTRIDPDYWWSCHLDVYFNYDYIGGPIRVNSYMTGMTLGTGWEQTAGTSAYWDNGQIKYTITGNEKYYIVVEGIGEVYSNPMTFTGTYRP